MLPSSQRSVELQRAVRPSGHRPGIQVAKAAFQVTPRVCDIGEAVAGLDLIQAILDRGELAEYHLTYAAQADLFRRSGQRQAARSAYENALALVRQEPERRFLKKRLVQSTD